MPDEYLSERIDHLADLVTQARALAAEALALAEARQSEFTIPPAAERPQVRSTAV